MRKAGFSKKEGRVKNILIGGTVVLLSTVMIGSVNAYSITVDENKEILSNNIEYVFDENEYNILSEFEIQNADENADTINEDTTSADVLRQVDAETVNQVKAFVSRMYTVALGRNAEAAGLKDWSGRLLEKKIDGAGIAAGFIGSEEFTNKNLNNDDYLKVLYKTFFDREPDKAGYEDWIGKLNAGQSRASVLAGFVNSKEFANLCDKFGILRGYMMSEGSAANPGIAQFVTRLYTKALGRAGEADGINDWTAKIATGSADAGTVAVNGFFNSDEFNNKTLTDNEFLDILYATYFDRKADSAGKYKWLFQLKVGLPRKDVVNGFATSAEFNNLLNSFGLKGASSYAIGEDTENVRILKAMLKFMDEYPEGTEFTNADFRPFNGGIYSGGFGCAGFAFMLSDAAFGDRPAKKIYSTDNIRVGDIIRINNDGHSVIVLAVDGDDIVVAEGNFNKSVHWGRVLNRKTMRFTYLMTRY